MADILNIAICDDDKTIQEILRNKIVAYSIAHNLDCGISVFSDGKEMRENLPPETNLLFLDVEMPGEDGMKAARLLREKNEQVMIVFLSGYNQYVFESFKVNAFRYLLKPLRDQEFNDTMDAIVQKLFSKKEKLVFQFERETYALDYGSIIYIEVISGKIWIYTSGQTYRWSGSIGELEDKLSGQGFFRVHRSYLINMRRIRRYTSKEITMDNGDQIPLSKYRYGKFREEYITYWSEVL